MKRSLQRHRQEVDERSGGGSSIDQNSGNQQRRYAMRGIHSARYVPNRRQPQDDTRRAEQSDTLLSRSPASRINVSGASLM